MRISGVLEQKQRGLTDLKKISDDKYKGGFSFDYDTSDMYSDVPANIDKAEPERKKTNKDEKRKTRYKISASRIKASVILFLVFITILLLCMSPIFKIKNITVSGNSVIKSDEIIKASGIQKGVNIFSLNIDSSKKKITSVGRINDVTISRSLPGKVTIYVDEQIESAYIKEKNAYVGIGCDCMVLNANTKATESVPIINGVTSRDSKNGEFIKFTDKDSKKKTELIIRMLTELKAQDILQDIKTINIKDLNDINLILTTDTLVNFGSDGEANGDKVEYKIAYLKAILAKIPAQQGGVIELADTDNVTSRMS